MKVYIYRLFSTDVTVFCLSDLIFNSTFNFCIFLVFKISHEGKKSAQLSPDVNQLNLFGHLPPLHFHYLTIDCIFYS